MKAAPQRHLFGPAWIVALTLVAFGSDDAEGKPIRAPVPATAFEQPTLHAAPSVEPKPLGEIAPLRQAGLMGTWNLGKTGALKLHANRSYAWMKNGSPVIKGKWRAATQTEMKTRVGDGIVLLDAKSGYDWIVTRQPSTPRAGSRIVISELRRRQIHEYGSRH